MWLYLAQILRRAQIVRPESGRAPVPSRARSEASARLSSLATDTRLEPTPAAAIGTLSRRFSNSPRSLGQRLVFLLGRSEDEGRPGKVSASPLHRAARTAESRMLWAANVRSAASGTATRA